MNFPTNLRRLRIHHGMTQGQMAQLLGIAWKSYQSYEEGRAQPSIEVFTAIVEMFEVSPREMIGGSPEQKVSDDLKKMQAIKKHIDTCYQLLLRSKI